MYQNPQTSSYGNLQCRHLSPADLERLYRKHAVADCIKSLVDDQLAADSEGGVDFKFFKAVVWTVSSSCTRTFEVRPLTRRAGLCCHLHAQHNTSSLNPSQVHVDVSVAARTTDSAKVLALQPSGTSCAPRPGRPSPPTAESPGCRLSATNANAGTADRDPELDCSTLTIMLSLRDQSPAARAHRARLVFIVLDTDSDGTLVESEVRRRAPSQCEVTRCCIQLDRVSLPSRSIIQ